MESKKGRGLPQWFVVCSTPPLIHCLERGFWVFIFCSKCQFIDELNLVAPSACVCYKRLAT